MRTRRLALLLIPIAVWTGAAAAADKAPDKRQVERGRYLAIIGGCNDCHTPHYMERGGKVPESEWLTGSAMGFQGPWGTTYPANLRLMAQNMTEAQWIARSRAAMRPPMPWFNLAKMTDSDLRALHRYLRRLGAKGDPAPAYAAPGTAVKTPYMSFVPVMPPATQPVSQKR
ncbi:MAG: cytochrome C [Betaproteobacteria bacterium]